MGDLVGSGVKLPVSDRRTIIHKRNGIRSVFDLSLEQVVNGGRVARGRKVEASRSDSLSAFGVIKHRDARDGLIEMGDDALKYISIMPSHLLDHRLVEQVCIIFPGSDQPFPGFQ